MPLNELAGVEAQILATGRGNHLHAGRHRQARRRPSADTASIARWNRMIRLAKARARVSSSHSIGNSVETGKKVI